ncbi:salicylate hydroxylase [Coprinopsis cinerea AmutBmut pab1-1]|nr:salicylate hydroxylase [Coprinopsis cinerea AmutBmut pab1-1]
MASQSHPQQLRVAIVGAGIGGLMLTQALRHMDKEKKLDVRVYEAAPALAEIGAGINLWLRSWDILKRIDLEETLLKMMTEPPTEKTRLVFQLRKSDQEEGVHMSDLWMKGGTMRFHRAELQLSLMSLVGDVVQLNRRLIGYSEYENHVELEFADGSFVNCDVLIAADGIKSAVRKQFLKSVRKGLSVGESGCDPVWSGSLAYRGLLSHEAIEKQFPGHRAKSRAVIYCGKYKHLVVYPLSNGKYTNVVCFITDPSGEGIEYTGPAPSRASQDELKGQYDGWEPEVQALLNCIESPTKWVINNLNPIERFAAHRVFLAGDAAHAMTPHQGAGAGQAIEDAYILASLLTDPSCRGRQSIPKIAEVYNTIRCPAANAILLASRDQGKWCELDHPGLADFKEGDQVPNELLDKVFSDISEAWEWVWTSSAEDDRKKAVELLNGKREEGSCSVM